MLCNEHIPNTGFVEIRQALMELLTSNWLNVIIESLLSIEEFFEHVFFDLQLAIE